MSSETIMAASFLLGCFLPFGYIVLMTMISVCSRSWTAVILFLAGQYVRLMFTHKREG